MRTEKPDKLHFTAFEIFMKSGLTIPSLMTHVPAGNRKDIEPQLERIDLNLMLTGGSSTYLLLHVEGDSMDGVVSDGDWVVLSREKEPISGDIVVARLNGEYTIKKHQLRLGHKRGLFLVPTNGKYQPTQIQEGDDYEILGVVAYIIKKP